VDVLREWWHVIVGLVAFIAWGARVEAGQKNQAKEMGRIEQNTADALERLETRIDNRRSEDMATIRGMFSEIKSDLRDIRMGK